NNTRGNRVPGIGSRTRRSEHRYHAKDKSKRGHYDWPKPKLSSIDGGIADRYSFAPSKDGEFDDQNRILGGEADQCYKSNLEIDIVVQSPHPGGKDRTENRKRDSSNDC